MESRAEPMKLLVIRHAEAEERSGLPFGRKRDAERRLTDEGRSRMRKAAKGLREIAPTIDVLATSPLVRARETAEIVAKIFGIADVTELAPLAPEGDPQALIAWLNEQPADATVAIVGHEPDLSSFASLLIDGNGGSRLTLKKGACGLIEFRDGPSAGKGTLRWLLQPGQLKKIGG
jgi:phosphohistidine phosphatase